VVAVRGAGCIQRDDYPHWPHWNEREKPRSADLSEPGGSLRWTSDAPFRRSGGAGPKSRDATFDAHLICDDFRAAWLETRKARIYWPARPWPRLRSGTTSASGKIEATAACLTASIRSATSSKSSSNDRPRQWDPKRLVTLFDLEENEARLMLTNAGCAEKNEDGLWRREDTLNANERREHLQEIEDRAIRDMRSPGARAFSA
jgi:hypothetical protein